MAKAVFLDRDGVINDNVNKHVNNPDELFLFPGVGPAIRQLKEAGFLVFVVTNQGGVGLGYMKEEMLRTIHDKMETELLQDGAVLDEIAYCAHKPRAGCACRKPEPGMIFRLAERHKVDLKHSYMVGDRDTDIYAGQKAGTKTVFIGSTKFPQADYSAPNLADAAAWILQREGVGLR